MKITLENCFFFNIEDDKIIYRMSKESLDEFFEGCDIVHDGDDYSYGKITLILEGESLKHATLTPIYKDDKGEEMDVTAQVDTEVIEDALENMEEDWDAFGRNIEEFHKF